MNDAINGRLEAYYEQGMEGRIIFAFLADNDLPQLMIFDDDNTILRSGTINLVWRRWWWDKHKLDAPIWTERKQTDEMARFYHHILKVFEGHGVSNCIEWKR